MVKASRDRWLFLAKEDRRQKTQSGSRKLMPQLHANQPFGNIDKKP
jgi:hypothetical protein